MLIEINGLKKNYWKLWINNNNKYFIFTDVIFIKLNDIQPACL